MDALFCDFDGGKVLGAKFGIGVLDVDLESLADEPLVIFPVLLFGGSEKR